MKPPYTATIQGRQCGKTLALEIARNMESSIFDLCRVRDTIPERIDVGRGTHQALKMLPAALDMTYQAAAGEPEKFHGIVVKVNPLLPDDGYAVFDRAGNVITCGTVKGLAE